MASHPIHSPWISPAPDNIYIIRGYYSLDWIHHWSQNISQKQSFYTGWYAVLECHIPSLIGNTSKTLCLLRVRAGGRLTGLKIATDNWFLPKPDNSYEVPESLVIATWKLLKDIQHGYTFMVNSIATATVNYIHCSASWSSIWIAIYWWVF